MNTFKMPYPSRSPENKNLSQLTTMTRFHYSGNTVDSLAFQSLAAQKALKLQKRRKSQDATRRNKAVKNLELVNLVKVAEVYSG